MTNIGIVVEREYMTRVKKKSFIILTILMPFLVVAMCTVPFLLGMVKSDDVTDVIVLDQTGKYAPVLFAAQNVDSTKAEGYRFIPADAPLGTYQKMAADEDDEAGVTVLAITDDLTANPHAAKIYSSGEVQKDLQNYVDDILQKKIRQDRISSYNIPELDNVVKELQKDFSVITVKWTKDGSESDSSTELAIGLGMLTAMLIYMFVMCYGAMVMQGVTEEKTSRIVEVLVGSVKPFDLMMGKILGVMLVGFTQILLWGIMLFVITTIAGISLTPSIPAQELAAGGMTAQQSMAGHPVESMMSVQQSPVQELLTMLGNLPVVEIAILFVLYFLGGYILYSSFYAAIGAAMNSQEDSSQFMMPMIIVMIFSLYAAMGSLDNTDGPLAFWCSLFPLTSPVVMMVRLPFGVPLWQEALSVILLYLTAIGSVWVGARIYRVGILMYGKKPTFKELLRWMTY